MKIALRLAAHSVRSLRVALLAASLLAAQWGVASNVQAGPNLPPVVTIVVPAMDAQLAENESDFAFSGTATDPNGDNTILRVEYRVNGGGFTTANGTANWDFIAAGLPSGTTSQVEVRAIDTTGAVSDIETRNIDHVTGDQLPTVTIVVPASDVTISGAEFPFSGTAFDLEGMLDRVEYRVNGFAPLIATGTDNWSFIATGLNVGPNTVEVQAFEPSRAGPVKTRTITVTAGGVPDISFAAGMSSWDEDAGPVSITVVLTSTDSAAVTVDYAVTGGSATRDSDYVLDDGILTIPAGSTSASFGVVIINDSIPEMAETVEITLSNASSNANLVEPTVHVLTINDDDSTGDMTDFRLDTWRQKMNAKNPAKGSINLRGEADTNPNAIDLAANGLKFDHGDGVVVLVFPGSVFQLKRGSNWKIVDPAKQQKGSVLLNIGGSSRTTFNLRSKGDFDALGAVVPPLEIELESGAFEGDVLITPTANKKGTSLSFNAKKTPGNFGDPELFVDALLANRVNNKTNKDSVRLAARIPGAPALNPAADTFVVDLGFFSITVPAGGWTVKGANLSFKTPKGPQGQRVTVKYNQTRRTISVRANKQAFGPALTADASVTVSYGTFTWANDITLQQKTNKSGSKDSFRY